MPANGLSPSVGIIGAGPGGLALGIFLRKAGFRDFTIFDREDGVGGTWRINTYPGPEVGPTEKRVIDNALSVAGRGFHRGDETAGGGFQASGQVRHARR